MTATLNRQGHIKKLDVFDRLNDHLPMPTAVILMPRSVKLTIPFFRQNSLRELQRPATVTLNQDELDHSERFAVQF